MRRLSIREVREHVFTGLNDAALTRIIHAATEDVEKIVEPTNIDNQATIEYNNFDIKVPRRYLFLSYKPDLSKTFLVYEVDKAGIGNKVPPTIPIVVVNGSLLAKQNKQKWIGEFEVYFVPLISPMSAELAVIDLTKLFAGYGYTDYQRFGDQSERSKNLHTERIAILNRVTPSNSANLFA